VLLRSLATYSLYTPHAGETSYSDDVPKIPAATITLEGTIPIGSLSLSRADMYSLVSCRCRDAPANARSRTADHAQAYDGSKELPAVALAQQYVSFETCYPLIWMNCSRLTNVHTHTLMACSHC